MTHDDQLDVIMIAGIEEEQFLIVTRELHRVIDMSDPMTESEARAILAEAGLSSDVIDTRIRFARENPR